jgi:hypothetical protein
MNRWLPRGVAKEARKGLQNSPEAHKQAVRRILSGEINQKSAQGWGKLALRLGFSANS